MPFYARTISVAALCLFCADAAFATTFCAGTPDELTAALLAAEQDTANSDEIRIRVGHFVAPAAGWHIDVQRRGIAIEGGYTDAQCQSRSLDASLTVLDGGSAVRPLTIDTSFVAQQTPTAIIVRGLTIENGVANLSGGLKISDSGPIYNGTVLVERNIFRNNAAGGLQASTDGSTFDGTVYLIVRGNLFAGNRASDGAAATLYSDNGIDVIGNTVSGNQSFDTTQATRTTFVTFTFSQITYSNNVFWANNPDNLAGTFDIRGDSPFRVDLAADLFNNDLQAVLGTPGTQVGNLSVDPAFSDPVGGNYRLASGSLLIDAGTDTPLGGAAAQDLDGNARMQGLHVDIGAFETASDDIFRDSFE
jgi:hypothetical protein